MSSPLQAEYIEFHRLIDAFDLVASSAKSLATLRSDQSTIWLKMAEAAEYSKDIALRIVGEGTAGKSNT